LGDAARLLRLADLLKFGPLAMIYCHAFNGRPLPEMIERIVPGAKLCRHVAQQLPVLTLSGSATSGGFPIARRTRIRDVSERS
jgi:hypothetical protein